MLDTSLHNSKVPIFGISRLRIGTDVNGITTLVTFMECPLNCAYCINKMCHESIFKSDCNILKDGVLLLTPQELYDRGKIVKYFGFEKVCCHEADTEEDSHQHEGNAHLLFSMCHVILFLTRCSSTRLFLYVVCYYTSGFDHRKSRTSPFISAAKLRIITGIACVWRRNLCGLEEKREKKSLLSRKISLEILLFCGEGCGRKIFLYLCTSFKKIKCKNDDSNSSIL